ncbi:hypothetical protein SLA2020_284160 [Shorea laevis]
MLALSPPLFSTNGWCLRNDQNGDPPETLESVIDFSTYHQTQVELDTARPPTAVIGGDSKMGRRNEEIKHSGDSFTGGKIHTGATRTGDGADSKEGRVLSRNNISNHDQEMNKQPIKSVSWSSLSSVSASRLDDRELVIQISTYNTAHKNALSEILVNLEEDGFVLINASSFESFEGRLFYNLHLHQVERTERLECESLSEKLISLYDKREAQALLP